MQLPEIKQGNIDFSKQAGSILSRAPSVTVCGKCKGCGQIDPDATKGEPDPEHGIREWQSTCCKTEILDGDGLTMLV